LKYGGITVNQYSTDTYIKNGRLELNNLPFPDNVRVKIFIIPKVDLSRMSFNRIRKITESIRGNLSDDIRRERDE